VRDDYKGDYTKLCDVVRCSIVASSEEQLALFLTSLLEGRVESVAIVRLKNRFKYPMFTGIRDCLINVNISLPDGVAHVGEVQLHLAPILALKGRCHEYYDFFREFFVGNDASYKLRLDVFERLGSINDTIDTTIEDKIREILSGSDINKLEALDEISSESVLGDGDLSKLTNIRLMELAKEASGEESEEFLLRTMKVAHAHQGMGEFDNALELCEKCLYTRERILGGDHPETLGTVGDIAYVYYSKEEYDKSLELFRRCLEGRMRVLGEEHPDTLTAMNKMARVYHYKGDLDTALEMLGRALAGYEAVLGKDDPTTLRTVNNIASLLDDKGDFETAIVMYRRCLEGTESALGRDHPNTLGTLNNMAIAYRNSGDYETALKILKRCAKGYEVVLGKEHPYTLQSVGNAKDVESKLLAKEEKEEGKLGDDEGETK
jgi:tetratricopeptide (TPR) repeat protein